ncbi:sugar phosphate isomerase/epimerase [Saxibacter everestensis]|uniref:Sugar phosphate isomerase/epimerase n=1 Tax=Saxibacter everestensis TaxID=2909229 RepID=A0ABY8QUZ7_9MICO|nr:sugar phosphate isomerase/epimerase [Brevibacteriaceae bacterium ZFBP1038]
MTAPMQISVQLYTVREAMERDVAETLHRIAGLGYTNVEPYGILDILDELVSGLAVNNLKAPSVHAPLLSGDQATLFSAAEKLGAQIVIDPFVGQENWTSLEGIREIAGGLNAAARAGAKRGLTVGYHNHDWELSIKIDGRHALEVLVDYLDDQVILEIDTYWAIVGGANVPGLLARLGNRVQLVHLKDGDGSPDTKQQTALGDGSVDLPAVLEAARNVRYGVVELDDTKGDIFDALAASLRYLG